MVKTKHILILAGAAASVFGVGYLLKLNRLSNELETVTNASIHKVSLTGIELTIKVTLKNPSGGSVRVKYPFVKLLYKDAAVASSQVKDVNITIKKFSEVNLEPVKVNLEFLTLALKVPDLIREYRASGKLNLTIKTVTTINDKLPYSKEEKITLGGGKQA
jgi:hypothetical protein